jgi:hypothetical protein
MMDSLGADPVSVLLFNPWDDLLDADPNSFLSVKRKADFVDEPGSLSFTPGPIICPIIEMNNNNTNKFIFG